MKIEGLFLSILNDLVTKKHVLAPSCLLGLSVLSKCLLCSQESLNFFDFSVHGSPI